MGSVAIFCAYEKLDYNGIYEYLYAMKHQKAFDAEDYPNGIPKEEFESLPAPGE